MSSHSRPLPPLRYPAFRRLLVANGLSGIGSGVQAVAVGYLAFALTHSAGAVGLLAFLALAPAAFLSAAGGELAVAVGPRRAGMVIYALRTLPWAALAALGASGHITFTELAIVTSTSGVLGALSGADLPDLIPTTVPSVVRDRAIAMEGAASQLSALIGPLIGGAVLAAFGSTPCFVINAVSYLPVTLALLWSAPSTTLRTVRSQRRSMANMPMMTMMPMVPRMRLRGTLERRDLRLLLVSILVFAAFAQALQSLLPVVAHRYSTSSRLLGELMATLAGGGLAATAGLIRLERRDLSKHHVMAHAMIGAGVSVFLLGVVPILPMTFVAVAGLGGFVAVLFAVSLSWIQLGPSPTKVKTRLVGGFFTLTAASVALGSLSIGSAINRFGMTETVGACGILVTGFGGWRLLSMSALRGVKPTS